MSSVEFTVDDIETYLENNVPEYQRRHIRPLLKVGPEQGIQPFDVLALELTGEAQPIGMVVPSGAPQPEKSTLWLHVLREVHEFVCQNGKKYKEDKKKISKEIGNIVNVIATAIMAQINLPLAVLQGLVVIALMSVAKIGVNGWCSFIEQRIAQ
jgi:hypothetical protein